MTLLPLIGCDACTLRQEWPHLNSPKMAATAPVENSPYRVLVVGEAPGEVEDQFGRQFIGKTGKYLRNNLPKNWERKLYWQNAVRCRPPENRHPTAVEVKCCSTYLEEDLERIKPHAILGLGDVACGYFCSDPKEQISKIRGLVMPVFYKGGAAWFMPTFHPSYVTRGLRKLEDGTYVNYVLPLFQNDIKNFFNQIPDFAENTPVKIDLPTILYPSSKEEALNLFSKLKDPFAIDIETFKLRPYLRDATLLTVAYSDGDLSFAFPLDWPGMVNKWGIEAFYQMLSSGRKWVAQHANMEYLWAWYKTGSHKHDFEDIEILARLYHQRKGTGNLEILSRLYLGFNIKSLHSLDKDDLRKYPLKTVMEYNGYDSWSELKIYQILSALLPEDQKTNYSKIVETIKSCVGMELKGLHIDLAESEKLDHSLLLQQKEIEQQARDIPEVQEYEKKEMKLFSISSPKVVAHVLTKYCGVLLSKTEKGNYVTDADELEKLTGKHPLVDITLDFREVQKLRSTYIAPFLQGRIIGVDGLIHPSYTTVHTATYRLSSEDPNAQNFPKRKHKEIRKQIIAPPGYLMAAYDYGQLEARVICMASKDREFLRATIAGEDVHRKWLDRILDLYPSYLERLAEKTNQTDPTAVRKYGRDIIKTDFVFASFYGANANSISNRTSIPLDIVLEVWTEFWDTYPGVKRWVAKQFEEYFATGCVSSLNGRVRNEVLPGNEPVNTPIQSTAAEIVLEAQIALFNRAMTSDINFMPRIQVHDDLIFYLPDGDDNKLEWYIREIGKEIVKPRFPFINVPLTTECRIGYNWAELQGMTTFTGTYYQ